MNGQLRDTATSNPSKPTAERSAQHSLILESANGHLLDASVYCLEDRVPPNHLLRRIKVFANMALTLERRGVENVPTL
jgi:hypothetical protein